MNFEGLSAFVCVPALDGGRWQRSYDFASGEMYGDWEHRYDQIVDGKVQHYRNGKRVEKPTFFEGQLTDVVVYDKALSAEEVSEKYSP